MKNILHLLKLEWLKFSKNAVVRTIVGIFIIGLPFIILLGKEILKDAGPPIPSAIVLYEFPTVWEYQGYVGNWFVSILLGFLIIYFFTSEISNRTMRQNILTGLTRKEYFLSKMAVIVTLSIGATVIYWLSALVLGLTHTDVYDLELVLDNNYAGIRFFLMSLGYLSFAFLIANLIRRGTLTLLVYLFYLMIGEVIIRMIIIYKMKMRFANFFPMNAVEDVFPNPYLRIPALFVNKELDFEFLLSYWEALGATVLYTVVFIFISWKLFERKDL